MKTIWHFIKCIGYVLAFIVLLPLISFAVAWIETREMKYFNEYPLKYPNYDKDPEDE